MGGAVLVLCLCVAPALHAQVDFSTPAPSSTTIGISRTTLASPSNVAGVIVTERNETHLKLQWEKVNNSSSYDYILENGDRQTNISGSDSSKEVTHTVSSLSAGTKYSFTLYTVFERERSSGFNFSAVTTPSKVANVIVTDLNETHLKLQWEKVKKSSRYDYILKNGDRETKISGSDSGNEVTHTVSSLSAGTKYSFTLYTVFERERSSGFIFSGVTIPSNVAGVIVTDRNETHLKLQWEKVNSSSSYDYILENGNRQTNISGSDSSKEVTHTVLSLSAGTKYSFTLYTVFERERSSGFNFSAVTTPSNVAGVIVTERNETHLKLQWEKVNNSSSYDYILENGDRQTNISGSDSSKEVTHTVSSLSAGTKYSFTLYTVFERERSSGFNFSAVTNPSNVAGVIVTDRNETHLKLQWEKVNNSSSYDYILKNGDRETKISGSDSSKEVTHTVSSLSAGTKYSFTLYTVFERERSSGFNFSDFTDPSNVDEVSVINRKGTELMIQWRKLNNSNQYSYILSYLGIEETITALVENPVVTHTVSSLSAGTKYSFTLYTVFEGERSSGFNFASVTIINCATSKWTVTNTSIVGKIQGLFSMATATEIYNDIPVDGSVHQPGVSFSGLKPGSTYTVSLWYEMNTEALLQCSHNVTLVPAFVTGLQCEYLWSGYGLALVWDGPIGVSTGVQVNLTGTRSYTVSEMRLEIQGLQPAKTYHLTMTSLSGDMRSDPVSISCQTDPRGVIAGSVIAILLILVIVCLGLFIWRRKPGLQRQSKLIDEITADVDPYKPIPAKHFPAHFHKMSSDQNRGFSEEYEALKTVATEQTRGAALQPENKGKNRFVDVLPYDWSRVRLSVTSPEDSDYINANYMPGFRNKSRQYIATQGPLSSTVSHFWRMVWEQRSPAIVMLTNCTEGVKRKCEQYWPLDYTPCTYENFLVSVESEQIESSWTLRQFKVKNRSTMEDRCVMHFHFTSWPDHGVPQGTKTLIQFSQLLRQHVESSTSAGPIVVHCSAGVGRTGTLIALDVLLQQLKQDEALGIAAFVHSMRQSRPFMVQTESQFVFLHQCIMDHLTLKKETVPPEPVYENTDMIYANAMALKQYQSAQAKN